MIADAHSKVQARHLKRQAYLYIRQSSLRQVLEHTESTQRQYALKQRAIALGWTPDQIVVVDSDQGLSGASAIDRAGFQTLVTEVGMGRAGIVMGLEVSRLARNSTDWHRLLEISALADTLILDEDGIYDPAHFNDRLLLGLNRPDSYNTSRSTSRGTWNCPEIRQQLRVALTSRDTVAAADISYMRRPERTTERGTADAAFSQTAIVVSESLRNPPWASAASGPCFAPLRRGGRYTPLVEM
jgi:hypothetical protein